MSVEWHSKNKDTDWNNEYKLMYNVPSYFFRYDNYIKGQENKFILKSVFGRMTEVEIRANIKYWFNACIGAYNKIKNDNNKERRLQL